jgi:hypothetical protein
VDGEGARTQSWRGTKCDGAEEARTPLEVDEEQRRPSLGGRRSAQRRSPAMKPGRRRGRRPRRASPVAVAAEILLDRLHGDGRREEAAAGEAGGTRRQASPGPPPWATGVDREGERRGRSSAWIRMEKRKIREEKRKRREREKIRRKNN